MDELLDELYQPEAAPSASKETSGCQYLSMSLRRQAWMGLQLHLLVAAHQLALFRTAVWMIALAAGLDHLKLDPARRTYVRLAHFHIHTGCHGSSFHRRCPLERLFELGFRHLGSSLQAAPSRFLV